MNNPNNFPCLCGHGENLHSGYGRLYFPYCESCFRKNMYNFRNTCLKYKPDNLKYLERVYEEKTKSK